MSASVFPAYVGMSPGFGVYQVTMSCVPRIRGDEPNAYEYQDTVLACSPHTWG